ncbi:MAG: GNAT family N-acetyltransferase [Chloroflexi bacterium]|nr:GNAT family N-acetyltransferase [Chloroflexota bacterium]
MTIRKVSESPQSRSEPFIRPPSRWLDIAITMLGLLGLVLFLSLYDQAFPTAAIDLTLSRAEIVRRAQAYMQTQGYELQDNGVDGPYKFALTFTGSSWTSYYLQHTLGISETNRLIQETDVPIWYWRARWFLPLQKEEFRVYLAPDGQIVALSHTMLEDAHGASLTLENARGLAQDYLTTDQGWDLANWEEISASSEDRPGGRTDHSFAWKQRDWDVGESELRLSVTVRGDEIGSYNYWLKTPETFQRDFTRQRTIAGFVDSMSLLLSLLLVFVILALTLWKARGQISTSASTAVGPAVLVSVIILLAGLNRLPLVNAAYDTTQSYKLFWLAQWMSVGFGAAGSGVMVLMCWFIGQWISKRVWPRQDRILSRRGDRWHTLARSGWRGLMLGMMMAGFVVIFYLVTTQFLGSWTPIGPDYSSAYATPLPFLGALKSGLLPAMWEELVFRLLLISGVLWLARSFTKLSEPACRFLALLIPGALWGFAHMSYVRDPIYLRGVELTMAAMLLEGLFFLRFDLATTIVAHFVYNAGLGALPLLRSGEPYFVASGLVILTAMLVPMMPHAARTIWRKLHGEVRGVAPRPWIRLARSEDLETLAAFPVDGFNWAVLLDNPEAVVLCLQVGEQTVGAAVGQIVNQTNGEISRVYVAPSWRRRYWGSELLDTLCIRLQEQGCESVHIQVQTDDTNDMRFMSSQTWKPAAMIFAWPLEPPAFPSWRDLLKKLRTRRKTAGNERAS